MLHLNLRMKARFSIFSSTLLKKSVKKEINPKYLPALKNCFSYIIFSEKNRLVFVE